MNEFRYDLVVVGGGSGGYAAARTARDLGATVAIVDRGPLGGLCILRGCMPSKTLIATSDLIADIRDAAELGVIVGQPTLDMRHVIARKRRLISGFADYRREGLETFPLFRGIASFDSPTRLRVSDETGSGADSILEAKSFVIATGSVIAPPALPGLAEADFIDSDEVLDNEVLPKSAIVLGGGYVGTELGQFLFRAGVDVTFLCRAPHLLSTEDSDVGDALTAYFRAEGIPVHSNVVMSHVAVENGKKVVYYRQNDELHSAAADEIFYALGRVPNVAGLNLERAGVAYHPMTGIDIGADLRTSAPNIFAVGDVTGPFQLVHVAIYQGEIAARNAVGDGFEKADYSLQKSHTIFTDPQVAIAGSTEKELAAAGVAFVTGTYEFAEHGKAMTMNKTKGFVKMIGSSEDGRILGAAVIGAHGSELIHEVIVAMHYNATAQDFARIPHLHPTLAEIWTYPAEEIAAQVGTARPVAAAPAVAG